MEILATCLLATTVLAPLGAFAQSSDAKHCQALVETYRTIRTANTDASIPEAINQCN